MKNVAIIDYEMGNVRSVYNALKFIGANPIVTDKKDEIEKAKSLILPGVGAFGDGISNIRKKGLDIILNEQVIKHQKPFLGICLGMQLICNESFEFGRHDGLKWLAASVVQFDLSDTPHIPHIGWNNITIHRPNPLIPIDESPDFYFVHSFHVVCNDPENILASCTYGKDFNAIINRKNIFGVQFHPEKSQKAGLALLINFLSL